MAEGCCALCNASSTLVLYSLKHTKAFNRLAYLGLFSAHSINDAIDGGKLGAHSQNFVANIFKKPALFAYSASHSSGSAHDLIKLH